ncbi:MAG TPA: TonB-dependent receptor [Vicinamibacterales bacterium]|nr:TonB-dependent receptor [Vicinamibacterales bacterium]
MRSPRFAAFSALKFLCVLCSLCVLPGAALAQSPLAELRVRVVDPTEAALIIARATVTPPGGAPIEKHVDNQGLAVFPGLPAGTVLLTVEADGFESYGGELVLKPGVNAIAVELPIAGLSEEVVVTEDTSDRGHGFTTTLGEAEIAELPDDPEELERALLEMAGPGAVLRVNGFRGGRLPPKSQIRQIRFRMNSYAADNHDAGGFGVDIITKPGLEGWRGMTTFGFRDESLNASNAFADRAGPEQYRRFGFDVSGPLARGKTSFSFDTDGDLSYDSQTIVAALPDRAVSEQVRQPLDVVNATARVQHALTESQTLLVEYQRRADERRNLGVGDFDLQSRAYSRNRDVHRVRVGVSGLVAPKISNELKVQFGSEREELASASSDPAIVVIDAFSTGGAGQHMNRRVREVEIENNLDIAAGRGHAIRAGILVESEWYRTSQLRNGNGTFTFPSLEAFLAGRPNSWTQRIGGAPIELAQHQVGIYVQDEMTFGRRLSLSVGIRQELQNTLGDRLNLAPRVGFTWSPGAWTFRGGWGVFNEWYDASLHEQTLLVDGVNQQDLVVLNPGYPDPFAGAEADVLPPSVIRAGDLDMPWVSQASIGAERTFGSLRVQANYMLQRGYRQLRSINANAPVLVPGEDAVRPDPSLGNITDIESTGREQVDRLHVGLHFMKPERRLFFNVNYTLSRTLNHSDSPLQLPADSANPDAEWGPSSGDARHRIFAMASFGIPYGLRVTTMTMFSSALPYTITTGFDTNGDGIANDRPAGVGRNTERGAASWNVNLRLSKAFSFGPPPPDDGSQGPRVIRVRGGGGRRGEGGGGPIIMAGPPEPGDGRFRVELYAQAYNVFNRVNYTRFSGNLQSPFFGRPTAAAPPRRIEVGAMFGF